MMDVFRRLNAFRLLALLGAAPVLTALTIWLVLIVWRGGWDPARQEQQLWYLGTALLLCLAGILFIVVILADRRIKGSGPAGVGFEIDDKDGAS